MNRNLISSNNEVSRKSGLLVDPSEFLYYDPYYVELRERHSREFTGKGNTNMFEEATRVTSMKEARVEKTKRKSTTSSIPNSGEAGSANAYSSIGHIVDGLSELMQSNFFREHVKPEDIETNSSNVLGKPNPEVLPATAEESSQLGVPPATLDDSGIKAKDRVITALYDEVDRLKNQLWALQKGASSTIDRDSTDISSKVHQLEEELSELKTKYHAAMTVIDEMNWVSYLNTGLPSAQDHIG